MRSTLTDSRARRSYVTLLATLTAASIAASSAHAAPQEETPDTCPDVHVLAVEGTGQSASDAPTKIDQGYLSAVLSPVLAAKAADSELRVDRTYIPYRANFGDLGGNSDYRDSAGEGLNRVSQAAHRIITQCANTKIVLVGYSQGGHVVDAAAAAIADGQAVITPDNLAFSVSLGSPTRAAGAPLFPTAPGQTAPTGLPEIGDLQPAKYADRVVNSGGRGIGPDVDELADFGPLNGRVAQFCIDGDLACSAPRSASVFRLGASIVEQSNFDFADDPTGSAARLAAAVADTAVRGTAKVINSDISGTSLADLNVNPDLSISERLAQVSAPKSLSVNNSPTPGNGANTSTSPSTGSGDDNPLRAIARLGTIALNTATTFATAFLTPENIMSMISAGTSALVAGGGAATSNPLAATVGGVNTATNTVQLGAAAADAAMQAIPPATGITAVRSIFQTLINEVEANADLPQVVLDARTWNQVAYHGGYNQTPVSATGDSATEVIADWIIAATRAYGEQRQSDEQKDTTAPKAGTTAITAPYRKDGDRTADAGAVKVNQRPATTGDRVLLARGDDTTTTPDAATTPDQTPDGATIPVALDNPALTEAQRMEVATDPRFVNPNLAQQLAQRGTLMLSTQKVTDPA